MHKPKPRSNELKARVSVTSNTHPLNTSTPQVSFQDRVPSSKPTSQTPTSLSCHPVSKKIRGSNLPPRAHPPALFIPLLSFIIQPNQTQLFQKVKISTMVSAFGRSLSFSNSPKPKPIPNYHVRSISLPSRSNPAFSQLESEIHSVRAWLAISDPSPASLCSGLTQLALLLDSFHDLLALPHSHSSLRRACSLPLLDQFLHLADACGSFRSSTVTLKQLSSDAQVAIRANDTARVLSCFRAVKRVEKELCLKKKIKVKVNLESGLLSGEELEMAAVMREVVGVMMAGLGSVFGGVVGECAASTALVVEGWTGSWVLSKMRRKGTVREDWKRKGLEKLGELEECFEALENKVERVFRSLVNARVSLLNILTPCV